ncbi:hypothetical protein HMPREF1049_1590 [Fusobacterium necrophorum subsp. funduliforme ATCC 51357]|nr:hypothetical protein [Fusobacterium necrophorum]EFS22916.2 hypothetical protein FSEG_00523 [Fusobacterium necrophorum D12]EIJ72462.1 hypothetical protein HMPREF1049_1590 [Fusobacterium necrophorum subsp. funduliforme ATCC 51357]KAB0552927.1 hypothetical protein F7P76_06075 [Fusobacterium necrophorum subsp. funduliforme]
MNYEGLDSKSLVLNLLGQDANIQVNKKILLTLGLEQAFYLSYLINQYKYFLAEGSLREDDSFYASNSDISLFSTLNNSQIQRVKKILVEKGFFKISIEGIPSVTYYYLNFEKILQIVASEKTNLELAYKNVYQNETINFEISSEESISLLEKLTYKELRFFCKENKIKYNGNDTKRDLIYKIVENKNPSLLSTAYFSTVDDISTTSGSEIRPLSKMGCSEDPSGFKTRPLVDTKSIPNLKQIKQKKNHDHEEHDLEFDFEKIFHELGVNYTKTNQESIERLLQKMKPHEIEHYIRELYQNIKENPNVKDINALFSAKIQKQECQINTSKKKEIETLSKPKPTAKTTYTREDIKNELAKYNILYQRSLFEKVKEEFFKVASKEDAEYIFEIIDNDITGFTSLTQLYREWIKVLFPSEGGKL